MRTLKIHTLDSPAGGNILIVGHAGSLDACFRQLCGKSPRNSMEFHEILNQFPYCCLAVATEDLATKRWMLKEPPIPSVCHSGNKAFGWKVLQWWRTGVRLWLGLCAWLDFGGGGGIGMAGSSWVGGWGQGTVVPLAHIFICHSDRQRFLKICDSTPPPPPPPFLPLTSHTPITPFDVKALSLRFLEQEKNDQVSMVPFWSWNKVNVSQSDGIGFELEATWVWVGK